MKSVIFGFIVASYVASAASDCWSPSMPGPAGCSVCTKDELKGSQCVRSGRWFGCYASAELCCKDGEVLNYTSQDACIKEAMKGQGGDDSDSDSDSDSDDEDDDSKISQDECQKVVARSPVTTNRKCMKECSELVKQGKKPSDDSKWSENCMTAHWHGENGRTVVDGQCFEKWVYGYSEPNNLASYKLKLEAETPALCQALCQDDEECVNWLWVSPLYAPGTEVAKRCMLKSRKMVDKPLGMSTEQQPPKNLDVDYCNYQMGYACQHLYKCLPCEGERRCVWESDMHISGWKYCDHQDSCSAESPVFPSVKSTTPVPLKTTNPATPNPTVAETQAPPAASTLAPATPPAPTSTPPSTEPTPAPTRPVARDSTPKRDSLKTEGSELPSKPAVGTTPSQGVASIASTPAPDAETDLPQTPEMPHPDVSSPQVSSKTGEAIAVQTTAPPAPQPSSNTGQVIAVQTTAPPALTRSSTSSPNTEDILTHGPAGDNGAIVTRAPATPEVQISTAPAQPATPSLVAPTVPKPAENCPSQPTQTGVILDTPTATSSTKASQPAKCPPSGCVGGCSCCGMRECGCCQQSGIVLRISERPKHLKFEVSNE